MPEPHPEIKVGDSVKVRDGVRIPDYEELDMAG